MAASTATLEQPKSHSLRWLAWLGVLAVAAGALWFAVGRKPSKPKPALKYETAEVTRGNVQARITASGTLSPLVTVQVGSQVSGRIQALYADFNSKVKKGEVIARLDPQLFKAAMQQAKAQVLVARGNTLKAEAQLENAQRFLKRNKALLEKNVVAENVVDTAATDVKVAEATLAAARGSQAQAEAQLEQAEINLAYTTIVSPIDGVVISRSVDIGQTVAASLQAPTLFTIARDLAQMQVDTSVAEADVGRIAKGMKARFTVDAYTNETFEGVIREVRNAPQTVQNVVTYDAVIDVENPELKLKPGMTANVTVVFADRTDVLKVPNAALRFRPEKDVLEHAGKVPPVKGDQRILWKLDGTDAKPLVVRVGVTDGMATELLEGPVKEGDAVVTEAIGQGRSKPGSFGRVF